jgi:predicted RNA binding protein YcfA (HicA-like mRNA interferase family)
MAKLPADLSGRQVRRALERAGFTFRRQRGSHMVLRRCNITVDEFLDLLSQ